MTRHFLLALMLASPAVAEDWRRLDGAGITAALSARVLRYEDGSTQNFFQDGRTLYKAGATESWGKWWARGGSFCASWPPSDRPFCYVVDARGLDLRFTGIGPTGGLVAIGRYIDL
jgi:hypothetical protein